MDPLISRPTGLPAATPVPYPVGQQGWRESSIGRGGRRDARPGCGAARLRHPANRAFARVRDLPERPLVCEDATGRAGPRRRGGRRHRPPDSGLLVIEVKSGEPRRDAHGALVARARSASTARRSSRPRRAKYALAGRPLRPARLAGRDRRAERRPRGRVPGRRPREPVRRPRPPRGRCAARDRPRRRRRSRRPTRPGPGSSVPSATGTATATGRRPRRGGHGGSSTSCWPRP